MQSLNSKGHDLAAALAAAGVVLPPAPKPVASYVPAVACGGMLFVSGQLPMVAGKLTHTGCVGRDVSVEDAAACARQCAINLLAIVAEYLGGDWSRLKRCVRLGVFVQCEPGTSDQPRVANGASDFIVQIMGDAGKHARAAVGTPALPLNAPVEVDAVFEIAA